MRLVWRYILCITAGAIPVYLRLVSMHPVPSMSDTVLMRSSPGCKLSSHSKLLTPCLYLSENLIRSPLRGSVCWS
jgi:hypothetical protein